MFLHGSYEIQVLDSYNNLNKTYPDGSNASLYRVAAPLVNVSRRPGEWQSYDIILHAPKCQDGKLTSPGDITVIHNGVLVQDRVVPRVRNDLCQPGMTELEWSADAAGSHSERRADDGHAVPQHLVPCNSPQASRRQRTEAICSTGSYGWPSRSCASLTGAMSASAQITTGVVSGALKDEQGAVIPGATVTLVSDTRGTRVADAQTNENGDFVLPERARATPTPSK